MEDNEFEEVTIISHTDHGTSVLPQSTAERLMKEIKLEVTQKISQNENVKLGSLQHSTTPTLLDSIYQNVLSSAELPMDIYFFCPHPDNAHKFFISLAQQTMEFDTSTEVTRLFAQANNISTCILPWRSYILAFHFDDVVQVFDRQTSEHMKTLTHGCSSADIAVTYKYIYFVDID